MKKVWFLLICLVAVQWTYAQSTVTIGIGSSVAVGNGSNVSAGYRDGTMTSTGYFNSRSITFDPVATAATTITQSSFFANWNAASGANGYRLDVSTVSNFSSFVSGYQNLDVGNVVSFNVNSNLSAGTTYYYRVRAYDIDGITGYSNVITFVTAPSNPVAAAATSINDISFSANWGSVTGATGYYLDVATASDFTAGTFVAGFENKDVGNVVTFSITGLTGNANYYYRIRARNAYGTSDNSNTITVLTAPAAPTAIAALPIGQTSFTAKWNTSLGATKYYLDVSLLSNFSTYVTGYQNLDVGSDTTYSAITNISAGTTYYYRVRASNGNSSSTNSNTISIITVPPNPVVAAATDILSTSFTANWNTSTGAAKYYLDVSVDINFGSFVADYEDKDVGNVTTFSVNTNLVAGTIYYYRVRAYNAGGTSGNSGTITVATIPPTPVATAASSIGQTSFSANWNAANGATKYYLDVSPNVNFTTFVTDYQNKDVGDVTIFSVNTNLTAGTTYYYRVRANNATGTSNNSNKINVITVPPQPISIAATNITEVNFNANWNVSLSASGYRLDVATDIGFGDGTFVAGFQDIDVAAVTTYLVTGLSANTTYYYRVRAYNGSGTSESSGTITQTTASPAPVANTASLTTQTSFNANWNESVGATGYYLDVATSSGFTSGTYVTGYQNLDVGNVLTFSINSNLLEGTTYYYRVRAYNANGISISSNTINLTTAPGNPIATTATSITSTSFNANWNAVAGASGYRLDVSTNSGFGAGTFVAGYENKDIGNVITSTVNTNLISGITYYYRVKAYNTGGTSGNSGVITVVTVPAAPTVNASTSIGETNFTANWNSSAGASGYFLDVATDNGFTTFVTGFSNKDVGNVTSYIVTGLSRGVTYYYRLRAYNLSGTGENSDTHTVLTTSSAPSATIASSITDASFNANWTASAGVSGYYLDVATDNGFTDYVAGFNNLDVANVVTYSIPGLTAGNDYFYRVRSYNASGTSVNSNTITVFTIPTAPAEQAATSITENSFVANWNASTGASGYYLDVATDNGFTSFIAGFNGKNVGSVTTYSVASLAGNTNYYYRIRAYNTGGTSTNSGTITTTTLADQPPAPAVIPATAMTTTSFSANWNASIGATGYYLDVATDNLFTNLVAGFDNKDIGAVTTYSVTGLTEGTTYYYRLRAYNGIGTSGNSSTIMVKTIPLAPVEQAAASITTASFDANWTASSGATGYYLDVATNVGFTTFVTGFENRDVADVTTYTVTGLTGGVQYFYRIRAYNTGGTSGNSETINLTTTAGGTVIATAATSILGTSFTANWDAYGGAAGYKLDVSTNSSFGAGSFVPGYEDLDVLNVTNYSVTGLSAGTNYYYRVTAYDAVPADLGTSGTINVLTLPPAPSATAATSPTETNFTANWNSATSATGYYLDVATDIGITSFVTGFNNKYVNSVNNYLITGLSSGTNYYYRVRAKNGSGISDDSGIITALTAPHTPTATYATAITNVSFNANWNASTGASGYRLDVSTTSDFSGILGSYNNLDVGNVTAAAVTGLSGGTNYYYRLRAYNNSGTTSNSATVSMLTLPSAPVEAAASSINKTSFSANWNASAGATKYYLDVATTSNFTGGTYVSGYQNLDVGNVIIYSVTGLAPGTNYYYRVRAFNSSGNSINSGTTTVRTIPPEPNVLSASAIENTSFSANWNASSGATGYRLDVSTTSDFSGILGSYNNLDVGNVTTYTVSGLSGGATYYYKVKAYNGSGTSYDSGIMAVLTAPASPTATDATSIGEKSFYANWNSSSGADGYKLDVSTDAGFGSFIAGYSNKDVGNVTTFPVTGLSGGTTYYFRIRSYSGSRISGNSNVITTLTKPAAPISNAATSIAVTSFSANWNLSAGASKYYLDVATNSSFTNFVAGFNNLDVGNVVTYSITSLTANTNYYYRIRAYNTTGTSISSITVNALTAPSIPTTLAETSITNTSFIANWNASAGATGYRIDVSTASDFSSYVGIYNNKDIGSVTTYSISGLAGNTVYYYRLRAYSGSGTSGNSGPDNITTALDPSGQPVATAATLITKTSFSANWNAVAGAQGYMLDVSTDWNFSAGTFVTNFNDADVGNVTTYSVSGLTVGATYYYRIRSYNVSGTSSSSGTITALTLPNEPVATAASSLASTSFSANWNSVPDITEYHLDVATDAGFTSILPAYNNLNVNNVTTYSITSLNGGTTYHFRVRAYNGSGASGNSNVVSALTIPSAPIATAATSPLESSFNANWNSVTGAAGYRLDVSTNPGFTAGSFLQGFEDEDVSNVTTYSISALTGGTTYYYRVRSYNAGGTSSNSNVITTITLPLAPVAEASSTVTGTSFNANWSDVTGAAKYYLDVSTSSGFDAGTFLAGYENRDVGNILIYSISGLNVNTNYYYRVRAYNTSGSSGNSNIITVLTAPLPPVTLDATLSSENSFTANWNSSVGATGYRIDVSTDIAFAPGTFDSGYEDKDIGNVVSYSVTGISGGFTHYYRLRAYNSGGTSVNSGTIKVLGVPNAGQATAVTITSFSANWNSVTGVLGYRLDVSTSNSFDAGTYLTGFENKDVGNVTTFPISGLTPNTTYYYRIRSYDAGSVSGNSNTILVKNLPNPPVAMSAVNVGQTNFLANWSVSVGGASGYTLDVATDSTFMNFLPDFNDKLVVNATSYTVLGLSKNTNYYYRLRAVNNTGSSGYSNIIAVRTLPNNAPIVSKIGNESLEYKIKGSELKLWETIEIVDPDDSNIEGAVVSVSSNYQKDEDKLTFTAKDEIIGSWDNNSGTLMFKGSAPLSEYISLLKSVGYCNTLFNTTKTNRVVSITVSDGIDNSSAVNRTIEIKKTNSAPVLSNIETDVISFRKGSQHVNISDSVIVKDEDNFYLSNGTVRIESNFIADEDLLSFSSTDSIHGEFNDSTGILSFSGKGKISEYENVLRSVKYSNTKGVFAKTSTKTISFSVSDGIAVSNISSRIIDIISPVLPPGGLQVSNDSNAGIILSWQDKSDNEDGFIITREHLSTNGDGSGKIISDSVGMNSTSYIDLSITEADYYRYSIQSYMSNGAISDLIPDNQKSIRAGLKKPEELEAIAVPSGHVELKWKDCSNVEEIFNIERSENNNDKFIKLAQVDKNLCHYNDSTIVNGTKYFYRVSAQKDTLISGLSNVFEIIAIVTDVYDETSGIPTDYILYQNYPNPFNPHTTIKYGLPKPGLVKLVLYNILGEELTTLVNAEQNAGYHKIQFNASQYSSGIYFCKINSEKFSKVIKMLLVK